MKKVLLITLAIVLTVGAAGNAAAQKFELGARAGIGSQNMDVNAIGLMNGKAKIGWHLAAVSRIRIIGFGDGLLGAGLFFQPEVVYSQSSIKGERIISQGAVTNASDGSGSAAKIRMQTVDVPLLLSLKVSVARIQAGPVFNLMNKMGGDWQLEALRPPVGYAVGASVDLLGFTIDARYHGEFKEMSFKGGDWSDIKSRFSSWSVGIGIMF